MKIATGLSVAASLALAACAPGSGGFTAAQEAAVVQQIVAGAKTACGYVAPAAEISGIVSSFVPGVGAGIDLASQMVNAICGAATKLGAPRGVRAGVSFSDAGGHTFTVHGRFR